MLSRLYARSQHLLSRLPARLLPSACALCGASGPAALCLPCHRQFFSHAPHRCRQCALPLPTPETTVCGTCLTQPPAFDATIVAADYAAPIDQLVLALKFGNRLALAPLFAQRLRDAVLHSRGADSQLPTLLTPVPLGPKRLAERGFNQSLEIAKPLARALGIELIPTLSTRVRDTAAQTLLPPDARQRNLRNAFMLTPHFVERVRGQHVGVVDDVITTGETLHQLAKMLKRFGASRVTNFVFARTLPKI